MAGSVDRSRCLVTRMCAAPALTALLSSSAVVTTVTATEVWASARAPSRDMKQEMATALRSPAASMSGESPVGVALALISLRSGHQTMAP